MTGQLSTPVVAATNYFVTPSLVGEGNLSTYYHRVDFGHANFDHWDFHEYGGLYNFYQNQGGKKENDVLIGSIQSGYGWKGLVNGHSVNADVPADAKFTDTILEWEDV